MLFEIPDAPEMSGYDHQSGKRHEGKNHFLQSIPHFWEVLLPDPCDWPKVRIVPKLV